MNNYIDTLNETIKTIQKVCRLRTCTDTFMRNRTRPCLLYQIGRCSAPCTLPQTNYNENVALARRILTGDSQPIIADLTKQMKYMLVRIHQTMKSKLIFKCGIIAGVQ